MVDSALRSSQRMSRLVADLLLLARADAGRVGGASAATWPRSPATPPPRWRRCSAIAELEVENGRALPVEGNPDELHRMVLNLLDNAVRHTPPARTIELRLSAAGRATPWSRSPTTVPASQPELREQVFDRFVRGDGPADTAVGAGSGLGLAIVHAVASSHGGTVEVGESARGGALFRVRLPLSVAERGITPALEPPLARPA